MFTYFNTYFFLLFTNRFVVYDIDDFSNKNSSKNDFLGEYITTLADIGMNLLNIIFFILNKFKMI